MTSPPASTALSSGSARPRPATAPQAPHEQCCIRRHGDSRNGIAARCVAHGFASASARQHGTSFSMLPPAHHPRAPAGRSVNRKLPFISVNVWCCRPFSHTDRPERLGAAPTLPEMVNPPAGAAASSLSTVATAAVAPHTASAHNVTTTTRRRAIASWLAEITATERVGTTVTRDRS